MKKTLSIILSILMLFVVTACSSTSSSTTDTEHTEQWPTSDLKIVVPFKAGAALDNGIRLLAKHWEKQLGVDIIIENRDGANSQIGVSYFLNTKDEDSYVIASAQPFLSSTILLQNSNYSLDDIEIMNYHEIDNAVIAVNVDSPYKTIEELNEAIKASPGELKFGFSNGGSAAILASLIQDHYGWDVKNVNYDGGTNLRTALLGGHVDFAATLVEGSIDSGTDRILAISADERLERLPDVPTLKELMGDDIPFLATFRYIGVKASMKEKYPERYEILLDSLKATYEDPEYQEALVDAGLADFVSWVGPEESARLHKEFHELAIEYLDELDDAS